MSKRLGNYLRVRRRQWQLSQKELAFLFGYKTDSIVSRYERQGRRLTLGVAFACDLIFGASPKELFPKVYEQVEDGVVRRMFELHNQLKNTKPSKKRDMKLLLLKEALSRATGNSHHQDL
jgi:transcriptional regulator with XRE-family HTH domain